VIPTAYLAHDAEWLLQRERLLNELMLDKGRRRKPRGKDSTRVAASFTLIPTSADEDAAAERAMRAAAARAGAAPADLAVVLEALGLIEPVVPAKTPVRPKPRDLCRECGRSYELSADGRVIAHSLFANQPSRISPCPGGRKRPQEAAA
jgi:hypothetical protein